MQKKPNNPQNARLPRFFCAWAIYPHPCPFIAICARFKRLLNTIAAPLSQGSLKSIFQAAFFARRNQAKRGRSRATLCLVLLRS